MKSSFRIKNQLSELSSLQNHLEALNEKWLLPLKTMTEINLLLDELVTNVIEHGDLRGEQCIEVVLVKKGRNLTIEVGDEGPPFDPTSCKSPDTTLPLEKRRCGGLGIHLVRKFSDSCNYTRSQNKNILTLKKTLPEENR